jgi:hypothetical protein
MGFISNVNVDYWCTSRYNNLKYPFRYNLKIFFILSKIGSVVEPDPESDPELFAGSGSGINHFGSGSGLIPNFSVKKSHFFNQIAQKIGIFST